MTTRAVEVLDDADLVAGAVEVVDFGSVDVVVPAPPWVVDVPDGADVDVELEVPVVVVTPEPVVVVVDDGAEVVVVGPDVVVEPVVVVVVEVPAALAITGAIGLAGGPTVVMPEGVTESLGYAVHVSTNALPATVSVRLAEESCSIVIGPEVAVNPLMVAGVEGSDNDTPASGTGLGRVTVKSRGPWATVAGVAPMASIRVVADPLKLGPPTAAAALANEDGRFTVVWYPVTLKDWPEVGAVGDNDAEVTASLSTTVPTGVPGQYSS